MPISIIHLSVFLLALVPLSLAQKPTISSITPEQIKDIDDSAELNCTVQNPTRYAVSWTKKVRDRPSDSFIFAVNDVLTFQDPRFSITYDQNTTTFSLKISKIQSSDTGIYECQIIISLNEKITDSVELLVRHPPIISDNFTTADTTVPEKKPVTLTCIAEGYPRPAITWKREYNAILPIGGNLYSGNVLTIGSVRREDRGTYYCMADNGVGRPAQKRISLEVEFDPVISVPRPKVAQALDYDIELECKVEAYPPPSIVWFRNGNQIYNNDDHRISHLATADEITKSVLQLVTLESDQYGDYYCKASNKVGQAEARINVFESPLPVLSRH